jgi:hydrogenase maturation protease
MRRKVRIRVIALGHPYAGDDSVGLEVVAALKAQGVPSHVEVTETGDATNLLHLIQGVPRVVIVDAVLGSGPEGEVLLLTPDQAEDRPIAPVSSHGLGVMETLRMAKALSLSTQAGGHQILLMGIVIREARKFTAELSRPVAAAIPEAVKMLKSLWINGGRRM